ncbi:MAG: tetratricopeptide repeat protein, partial [Betaproteobacteria bacterium]|nr:tetratricopeptide repeat protein [Betaproteobacteria bacterium]
MYRARILLCTLAFAVVVPAEAGDLEDAQQLLESGRTSEALERVNRALATNPKDPQPRFLKGLILVRREQEQEAIDIFMKLTQDYPKFPEPYNNLAVIYANRGQYDKARVALEAGARASPTYAVIHENLGDVYAKLASQSY